MIIVDIFMFFLIIAFIIVFILNTKAVISLGGYGSYLQTIRLLDY